MQLHGFCSVSFPLPFSSLASLIYVYIQYSIKPLSDPTAFFQLPPHPLHLLVLSLPPHTIQPTLSPPCPPPSSVLSPHLLDLAKVHGEEDVLTIVGHDVIWDSLLEDLRLGGWERGRRGERDRERGEGREIGRERGRQCKHYRYIDSLH